MISSPAAGRCRTIRLVALALALSACSTRAAPPLLSHSTIFAPDSARTLALAPGVRHSYLWIARGPWAVHLVEVDPRACGIAFRAVKGGDRLIGREPTSGMARRSAQALGRPVLAAINADFFSFDPPGVPEGPQVTAGEVLKGQGGHREAVEDRRLQRQPVFGIAEDGRAFIGDVTLRGTLRTSGGVEAEVERVNTRPQRGLTLYTRFGYDTTPADTGVVEVSVRRIVAADRPITRAVVVAVDTSAAGVSPPTDGVVVAGRGSAAGFLQARLAPGDTVAWHLGFEGAPGAVRELVGGFPHLLRGGESVLEGTPGLRAPFADVRHPRAAVALRPDGTVLLLAVDGRQPAYSAGMTLSELRDLLRELGAIDALNLDGGGSTTLVLRGVVVNRPSDQTGERPVANALLVLGSPPGRCGR